MVKESSFCRERPVFYPRGRQFYRQILLFRYCGSKFRRQRLPAGFSRIQFCFEFPLCGFCGDELCSERLLV